MNELDGATEIAEPNVTSTPAQFAAYWNTRTDEARTHWLAHVRSNSQIAMTCFIQQHERVHEYRKVLSKLQGLHRRQTITMHNGSDRGIPFDTCAECGGPDEPWPCATSVILGASA